MANEAVVARWTGWDGEGLEHCNFVRTARGLSLEGVVAGTRDGIWGCHYRVDTDADLRTRSVRVSYLGGPELHALSDGEGHWRDALTNGCLPELEGCIDVDIGATPATNSLPILRLDIPQGGSREIAAAYVPLPGEVERELRPWKAGQRYTCLEKGRLYRYDGLSGFFSAELEVDTFGLVRDYPDTFRRVM